MISTVIPAQEVAVPQMIAATLGLIGLLAVAELAYVAGGETLKVLRRNILVFAVPLLVAFCFTLIMVFLGFMS